MPALLKKPTALQPGERVLVTGANSYIGSHIVDLFLSLGYLVRGTIRAEKPWLDEYFMSRYGAGKYESVIVPDVTQKGALAKVLGDVSGFIQVVRKALIRHDSNFTLSTKKQGLLSRETITDLISSRHQIYL